MLLFNPFLSRWLQEGLVWIEGKGALIVTVHCNYTVSKQTLLRYCFDTDFSTYIDCIYGILTGIATFGLGSGSEILGVTVRTW